MCVYVCVYACVRVCVCVFVYIHIPVYIYMFIHEYACVFMHACTYDLHTLRIRVSGIRRAQTFKNINLHPSKVVLLENMVDVEDVNEHLEQEILEVHNSVYINLSESSMIIDLFLSATFTWYMQYIHDTRLFRI